MYHGITFEEAQNNPDKALEVLATSSFCNLSDIQLVKMIYQHHKVPGFLDKVDANLHTLGLSIVRIATRDASAAAVILDSVTWTERLSVLDLSEIFVRHKNKMKFMQELNHSASFINGLVERAVFLPELSDLNRVSRRLAGYLTNEQLEKIKLRKKDLKGYVELPKKEPSQKIVGFLKKLQNEAYLEWNVNDQNDVLKTFVGPYLLRLTELQIAQALFVHRLTLLDQLLEDLSDKGLNLAYIACANVETGALILGSKTLLKKLSGEEIAKILDRHKQDKIFLQNLSNIFQESKIILKEKLLENHHFARSVMELGLLSIFGEKIKSEIIAFIEHEEVLEKALQGCSDFNEQTGLHCHAVHADADSYLRPSFFSEQYPHIPAEITEPNRNWNSAATEMPRAVVPATMFHPSPTNSYANVSEIIPNHNEGGVATQGIFHQPIRNFPPIILSGSKISINLKDKEIGVPIEFFCPLTKLIMEDPVNFYNYTCERWAIEKWLFEEFEFKEDRDNYLRKLSPNNELKAMIDNWLDQSSLATPNSSMNMQFL